MGSQKGENCFRIEPGRHIKYMRLLVAW